MLNVVGDLRKKIEDQNGIYFDEQVGFAVVASTEDKLVANEHRTYPYIHQVYFSQHMI